MKKQKLFLKAAAFVLALLTLQQKAFSQCTQTVNLITNGDFSNGFTGFTSALPQATVNNPSTCATDSFGIGTAFDDFCTYFPSTPSGTNMMVVDFDSTGYVTVLQQSISNITAGITYTVSFRGASRSSSHNVPVDVFYGSYSLGTITINTAQAFGNYSLTWTAPAGVPASGNFMLRTGDSSWYDFAITDVAFSYCLNSFRTTYQNGKDHNHFSVAEVDDGYAVAGTLYKAGGKLTNTTIGVRRFNSAGSVLWQKEYDMDGAYSTRCFDVSVGGQNSNILALTGCVQAKSTSAPKTFLMLLSESNGTILKYIELPVSTYSQSTGLDVIYSRSRDEYYIAGYEANDILDVNGNKMGFVLALDKYLNIDWVKRISSPASSSTRNMANNLTEIPGKGIFVTGSVNNNMIGTGTVSTLKLLLDYTGSTVWDLTSISTNAYECGVDAVYDNNKDILYVLSNNSVVHTFEIQEIDDASLSTASIGTHGANDLHNAIEPNGGDVAGFSLAFDPHSTDLIVAGMIREMQSGSTTPNTPSFIAHINKSTYDATGVYYIEANNPGYRDHDYDMFQAFYGQQALINYPDILGVLSNNFVLLGYVQMNGYSLSITQTNYYGETPSSKDCEVFVDAHSLNTHPTATGASPSAETATLTVLTSKNTELTYTEYPDCKAAKKATAVHTQATGQDGFKVYPNPVAATLQVKMPHWDNAKDVNIRLIDAMGRTAIAHNSVYAPGAIAAFNVSTLPDGVYFLVMQSEDYEMQKTVVISH